MQSLAVRDKEGLDLTGFLDVTRRVLALPSASWEELMVRLLCKIDKQLQTYRQLEPESTTAALVIGRRFSAGQRH